MDRGVIFPLPSPEWALSGSVGALAALLLVAAWLVVLPALPVSRTARVLAGLPGLPAAGVVVNAVVVAGAPPAFDDQLGRALAVLEEVSVLLAILVLAAAGLSGPLLARATIVAVAATSTGFIHQAADYVVSLTLSAATWDIPPGAGFLLAGMNLLAAVLVVVLWRRDRRRAEAAPAGAAVAPS